MAHQHYKGTGQMHSFKGILATDGQARIRIEGATGEIAWRINKFQIMADDPGVGNVEAIVQIFREEQDTPSATVNFSNDEHLAVAFIAASSNAYYAAPLEVIFDNALFVRNIYVTVKTVLGSSSINYYIELEEVKVSAAGMAQLAVAASRRT